MLNRKTAINYNSIRINLWLICGFLLCFTSLFSQHPYHIVRDDESGLPSNEVYSIVEDKKGFIWIGCDAGLFRFNGVRYQSFTCKSQEAKSISGLCFSKKGILYCYNFKGQLFAVTSGEMREIKHTYKAIQDIATDNEGHLFLNHNKGLAVYNELTKQWKNKQDFGVKATYVYRSFTKSIRSSERGNYFVSTLGVGQWKNGFVRFYHHPDFRQMQLGGVILSNSKKNAWVFSSIDNRIYKQSSRGLEAFHNSKLENVLKDRKVTNVRFLKDGYLWICTFTGVIKFHPETFNIQLLYPQYSFSDVLIDRNGKYWFSTLHNGILMVPGFNSLIWNKQSSGLLSDKITHITALNQNVYFTTGNGQLGVISNTEVQLFPTSSNADIQTLYADERDNCLYFSQSNVIYRVNGKTMTQVAIGHPSVKKILHFDSYYFFASSNGLLMNKGKIAPNFEIINRNWTRDLIWIPSKNELWTASNEGCYVYEMKQQKLRLKKIRCEGKQILSLAYDKNDASVYALTYSGEIVCFSENGNTFVFDSLSELPQVNQLKIHGKQLFVTTSKGVFQNALASTKQNPSLVTNKKWTIADGLASASCSEICFIGSDAFLAGGKGVQRFRFKSIANGAPGNLFINGISSGTKQFETSEFIELAQGEGLSIVPETNLLSTFGNFQYRYRFNEKEEWTLVNGTVNTIDLPAIPEGKFTLYLSAVDDYGRPTSNAFVLKGYKSPPFYRATWFFVVTLLVVVLLGFGIYKKQIKRLEYKQAQELQQLQLEADLRLTQQTALKAQMNPHFIFNVLNSIKSYIYKNEKAKAANYLSDFSDLIRGILNMTSAQYVSLREELDFLKTYIELEAMLLDDDFEFQLELDEQLDLDQFEIPSLLLQPFIENAFKHGLMHSDQGKKLKINVSTKKEELLISIEDNGIGRSKAQVINAQRATTHQSFATNAIAKRIELINRDGKMLVTTEIMDSNQNGTGTHVEIQIQFNTYER